MECGGLPPLSTTLRRRCSQDESAGKPAHSTWEQNRGVGSRMQYRTLGNTGLRVSQLGFGAMRLPMRAEGDKQVVPNTFEDRLFDQNVLHLETLPEEIISWNSLIFELQILIFQNDF